MVKVVVITVIIAGCDTHPDEHDPAATLQRAQSLMPANKELADIYRRSCMSCHTQAQTTAPLTGNTRQWKLRMTQGMDTLLDHVIEGYGGMPPLGLCMECEPEHFEALINFMAQ
jgi:cytochrome c5